MSASSNGVVHDVVNTSLCQNFITEPDAYFPIFNLSIGLLPNIVDATAFTYAQLPSAGMLVLLFWFRFIVIFL